MALKKIISALLAPKNGFCQAISYKYVFSHVNFFEPIEPIIAAEHLGDKHPSRSKEYENADCGAFQQIWQTRICSLRYDVVEGWVLLLDIKEIETA